MTRMTQTLPQPKSPHTQPIAKLLGGLILALGLIQTVQADPGKITKAPPSAPYQSVHDLVQLPEFIPGMGSLYVDPATLPAGPFLGYDRDGRLVNLIYMVPLERLNDHQALMDLGSALKGSKVDHTDLQYNPGHAGVAEPHYHITQWLISHDEEQSRMK